MGMSCSLLGLTPAQVARLRMDPSLAPAVIDVLNEQAYWTFVEKLLPSQPAAQRPQLERQMKEALTRLARARERLTGFGSLEEALDLDKSWHVLHYVFTGGVGGEPLPAGALLAGDEVGPDVGYGPARLLGQAAVRQFSDFLGAANLEYLQDRVDVVRMSQLGIYGTPVGPGPSVDYERELREWVASMFPPLKSYVAKMAQLGDGLLVWLS
jgi:hypothetical protein